MEQGSMADTYESALNKSDSVTTYQDVLYDHVKIAESDTYELYLYEPTLSIILKDKTTGQIMESTLRHEDTKSNATWLGFMKSGLVLNVIDGVNDTVQVDMINNQTKIDVVKYANGFEAKINFLDFGFELTMSVALQEEDLIVEILDDSIVESNPKYCIGAINVYPFLGYSYLGETPGYMMIPDGNGALIYLEDKEGKFGGGFSQLIFGDDAGFSDATMQQYLWGEIQMVNEAENILAPVFGMVHTDKQLGFLGIVEQGEERASIEAYPNGVTVDYNRIYPKFIKRKVYVQPTSQSNSGSITQVEKDRTHTNIRVRYRMIHDAEANYTGLATKYREYLQEVGQITQKDLSYKTRIDFLGAERENGLLKTSAVNMTKVKDIESMYQTLQAAGVGSVLSLYKGWQSGGLYNLPVTEYKLDKGLGSTASLTDAIKDAQKDGYELYLYQDALRINPDENNSTFNVVKQVNKRLFQEEDYETVYDTFLYLIPKRSNYLVKELSDEFLDDGMDKVALSGVSNHLFSYNYSGDYYTRQETMYSYYGQMENMSKKLNLLLEQPFAYLWKFTNGYLDLPLGSSSYAFVDEEVPFLSIALKGVMPMYSEYVNFEANKKEFFLQLVEMGVYPSFYITYKDSSYLINTNSSEVYSSKFDVYKDEIIAYDKELRALNEKTEGEFIVQHEKLDNGVTKVTYSNGICIYINYSNENQSVDGITVSAMSYKVGEAQ
jgi:hypothetical protein